MVSMDLIVYLSLLENIASLSMSISGVCVLYQNFYYTFGLLAPFDKAWSQVFIQL
jgi:hypothetical protein